MISFVLLSVFVAASLCASQRYRLVSTAMAGSTFFLPTGHAALVTVNINGENCIAPFQSTFTNYAERPCGWGMERSQQYIADATQVGLLFYSAGQRNLFGFGNPATAGQYGNSFWSVQANFARQQNALLNRVTNAEIDLRFEYFANAQRAKTVLGRNAAGEQLGTRPRYLSTDDNAIIGGYQFSSTPFDKCFLIFDNNGAAGRPNSYDFIATGLFLITSRPTVITSPSVVFGFWAAAQAGTTTTPATFFSGAARAPTVTAATGNFATDLTNSLGNARNGNWGLDAFGVGTARPLFEAQNPTGTGDITTGFVGTTTGIANRAAAIWPLTYQSSQPGANARNDRVLQACFTNAAGACQFHPVAALTVQVCATNFGYFE